jgi:hypothetical protein
MYPVGTVGIDRADGRRRRIRGLDLVGVPRLFVVSDRGDQGVVLVDLLDVQDLEILERRAVSGFFGTSTVSRSNVNGAYRGTL